MKITYFENDLTAEQQETLKDVIDGYISVLRTVKASTLFADKTAGEIADARISKLMSARAKIADHTAIPLTEMPLVVVAYLGDAMLGWEGFDGEAELWMHADAWQMVARNIEPNISAANAPAIYN